MGLTLFELRKLNKTERLALYKKIHDSDKYFDYTCLMLKNLYFEEYDGYIEISASELIPYMFPEFHEALMEIVKPKLINDYNISLYGSNGLNAFFKLTDAHKIRKQIFPKIISDGIN